jgi:hypothetical protein
MLRVACRFHSSQISLDSLEMSEAHTHLGKSLVRPISLRRRHRDELWTPERVSGDFEDSLEGSEEWSEGFLSIEDILLTQKARNRPVLPSAM